MIKYPQQPPQQQQQQPSTPQRTVLMLSPMGGNSDYSHLLPSPPKFPSTEAPSWMMKSSNQEMTSLPTLTPEHVQQKLQSPCRTTVLESTEEARNASIPAFQHQTRMSAFTSPQQQKQQHQQRRSPTEAAHADSELSFFSRVTDSSSSGSNLNKSMDSVQVELTQNLRPLNQPFPPSPQLTTTTEAVSLDYLSQATTPTRSKNNDLLDNCDPFSSFNTIYHERHIVSDGDVAGVVIPVKAAATFATPSTTITSSGAILVNEPVQQHDHLMIQQRQESLQRELKREFYEEEYQYDHDEELALHRQLQYEFQDEQNIRSRLEYQFQQIDVASGKEDISIHPTTFFKFSSAQAYAGDVGPEQFEQAVVQQQLHTNTSSRFGESDVRQNLFNQHFSLRIEKKIHDLTNSESSEPLNRVQKQVVESMTAIVSAKVGSSPGPFNQNCKSLTPSEECREKTMSTLHIANSSSGNGLDALSVGEHIDIHSDIEEKNSAVAVESTLNCTAIKLNTLARQMSMNPNDSEPEELSLSSTDPDTNSGFDLMDLAGELRSNKIENESRLSYEIYESHQARHQCRHSDTSFETFGAPKPASLAKTSVPPRNLQKPVLFNPAIKSPRLQQLSEKKFNSLNNKIGRSFLVSKCTADNRTRAVSPIVRMRTHRTSHVGTTKQSLCAEDIAALGGRKWKDKMKIIKRNRKKEKSIVDEKIPNSYIDREKQRYRTDKTKFKLRKNCREPPFFIVAGHKFQIPTEIPSCNGGIIELLERFISTRCGNVNDTYDGREEGDDESLDSYQLSFNSDDFELGTESETSTLDKQLGSKSTTRSQTVTHVAEQMPKHTITADINDKQFIRQFIATATTEGFLLLSHMKNPFKALCRPSKNAVFIRRGAQSSSGKFVGPKLVWKEIKGNEEGEIDLFAIRSIEKATVLELENYPYALPRRSLFLRLDNGLDYVFEAKSEADALHFVHGMRWIIARLAFNLIIGNVSVSCELLDVGEKAMIDDRYGMFPRSVNEETRWVVAMNEATTHLVQGVSCSPNAAR